jgi:hypothetical protein
MKPKMKRFFFNINSYLAGRSVTEGEVEEMLESGNPAVFTQGVSFGKIFLIRMIYENVF